MEKPISNAERFITIFNKIDKYLRRVDRQDRHGGFVAFGNLVYDVSKYNKLICTYREDLREYAELRNVIVHQFKGKSIAEPHDEVVQQIKKLYENLTQPPVAYTIASKPVFVCSTNDFITDVIQVMTEKTYTHIPVYEESEFIGVFSESSITKWIRNSAEDGGFILEETKIGDLKRYLDRSDNKFNSYKFLAKNTDVFSIQEAFLSFVQEEKRLGAIFITETGKVNEKLLGIITAWDIPKIKSLLQ